MATGAGLAGNLRRDVRKDARVVQRHAQVGLRAAEEKDVSIQEWKQLCWVQN